MERKAVKSSNIKSIGYDPVSQTLEVEFNNGHIYHYNDVKADEHAAFLKADSIGKHFHQSIRHKPFIHKTAPAKTIGQESEYGDA